MKKAILIAVTSGFFLSSGIFANDICSVIGYHDPKTNTYDGPTFCTQATINGIVVYGPLETDQSAMNGITNVSGPIKSTKTQFDGIVIENNHAQDKVLLSDNSVVKNNIVFQGTHPGTVIVDSTSKVVGQVINGDIEHQ